MRIWDLIEKPVTCSSQRARPWTDQLSDDHSRFTTAAGESCQQNHRFDRETFLWSSSQR